MLWTLPNVVFDSYLPGPGVLDATFGNRSASPNMVFDVDAIEIHGQ